MPIAGSTGGSRGSRLLWIALLGASLTALALLRGIGSGGESLRAGATPRESEARPPRAPSGHDLESAPSSRRAIVAADPTAAPPSSPPAAANGGFPTGDLKVTVLAGDRPAGTGVVQTYFTADWHRREQEIDPTTGATTFTSLPPGDYHVLVDRVPKGWLPPRVLRRRGPDNHIIVRVDAGANACEVALEKPAHVVGTVIDSDGKSTRSGAVQFMSLDDGALRAPNSSTQISSGEFEDYLYPGVWAVEVRHEDPGVDGLRGSAAQVARLDPGATTRVALEYPPAGTGVVSGRIADELGNAFGGLGIQVDLVNQLKEPKSGKEFEVTTMSVARCVSSGNGEFRLSHLQPGRYRLFVERYGFHPFEIPEASKVGSPIDPVVVEVLDGQESPLDLRARRPRRAQIRGKIELDPAWIAKVQGAATTPALRCSVQVGPPAEQKKDLDVRNAGLNFDFVVEVGSPDPRIVLTLGDRTSTYPIQIPAGGELEPLVLRFPQ